MPAQYFLNRNLPVENEPTHFDTCCAERDFQAYCKKNCKNSKNIKSTQVDRN